jgi:hypothetical protein
VTDLREDALRIERALVASAAGYLLPLAEARRLQATMDSLPPHRWTCFGFCYRCGVSLEAQERGDVLAVCTSVIGVALPALRRSPEARS